MDNKVMRELKQIEIPKELHERAKLGVKKAKSEQSTRKFKNQLVIPLAASLFLVFSVGVGAASIPSFNSLLSIVSPSMALMLQPIESSSQEDGIKMDVVAAMNDDEMAVIYVTIQDLTSNRIDETLDLYDYSFTGAHMFNSQIVDYDESTKTATLRIQGNGGEKLNDKKVNLRIKSFLSHKQTYENVEVNANLMGIKNKMPQTIPLDMNNIPGGGGKMFGELQAQGTIQILKPDENVLYLPEIEFMEISNIGFIDNRLHIQAKWTGDDIDSHGYFYYIDSSGNKIHSSSVSLGIDELGNTTYGHEYNEYIFDVENVDLNELQLLGYFVSNGNYTTGNWDASFKIKSVNVDKEIALSKDFESWIANSISISPLGVTLYGDGEISDSSNIVVSAKMNDGIVQTFDSMTSYSENGNVKLKFISSLPFDTSEVESINIDGTKIDF